MKRVWDKICDKFWDWDIFPHIGHNNRNKRFKMAEDIMSKFYSCLNLRVEEKLIELTKLIDHSAPNKDLQAMFPQLINNIFCSSFNSGWNLKTVTCDHLKGNRHEFEALIAFLEPQGPMFRLCYKLMCDQQLKYDLPINLLPLELQMCLERRICPQFYSDMLVVDSKTMNFIALALNPFDYYIFNFALHLLNNSQQQHTWENWNSVYFALSCDYLVHFLPVDPNVPVTPLIPNYTGKLGISAPLQTASRPLHTPLLLIPDVCGMSSQHSPQSQSRNEVWRSETVLQVFVDFWMSVEEFNPREMDVFQRNLRSYQSMYPTPERVRTVRVLVKHIHSYSAKQLTDTALRSSTLRKYARQVMCARAYRYVKHLVLTWPLDASFRLVLELWLSLIQPWRYTDNNITHDRYPGHNNNQEESAGVLDSNYMQFIAENFPSYTCILLLVLPRFMGMDLMSYKNAVMLFRLGKVFSQQHLVPILWNLEQAMTDGSNLLHTHDTSYNNSSQDQSYTYNGVALHKWVAIAKQAITELNMSTTFEYDPVWSDNKAQCAMEFVKKIHLAKLAAESNLVEFEKRMRQNNNVISNIKHWLMIQDRTEDEISFEECKKVPAYLNNSIHYFSSIFGLNENSLAALDPIVDDSVLQNSSFANSTNFMLSITNKLRSKPTSVQYMGNPDLVPIASYENTVLVRMLYQISTKINELYREEFRNIYQKNNLLGYMAREVLEKPCTIRNYVKHVPGYQNIVTEDLPPRLSLRIFGSYPFIIWVSLGYFIMRMFSYSGLTYLSLLMAFWLCIVFTKAVLKMLNIVRA